MLEANDSAGMLANGAPSTVAELARLSGGSCHYLGTDHILQELKSAVGDKDRTLCWGRTVHMVPAALHPKQGLTVSIARARPLPIAVLSGADQLKDRSRHCEMAIVEALNDD